MQLRKVVDVKLAPESEESEDLIMSRNLEIEQIFRKLISKTNQLMPLGYIEIDSGKYINVVNITTEVYRQILEYDLINNHHFDQFTKSAFNKTEDHIRNLNRWELLYFDTVKDLQPMRDMRAQLLLFIEKWNNRSLDYFEQDL